MTSPAQPLFTMNTLIKDKTVGRADLPKVAIENLVIVEGFNESRKFNDPAELRAHIDGMKAFVRGGGTLPPIEVAVNPETGATEVVEGHCRTTCFRELLLEGFELEPGKPLTHVPAIPFKGSMAQRRARIVTSNSQLPLSDVGRAMVYKAMREEDGMHPDDIAAMVNKSRAHVDQMLILASDDGRVHQEIVAGTITATEAVHVIRDHGDKAADEIERLKLVAAESGKTKITSAVRKKTAVAKREWPTNVIASARAVAKSLGEGVFESVILGNSPELVEVKADILAELLMSIAEIPEDEEPVAPDDSQMDMLEGEE